MHHGLRHHGSPIKPHLSGQVCTNAGMDERTALSLAHTATQQAAYPALEDPCIPMWHLFGQHNPTALPP